MSAHIQETRRSIALYAEASLLAPHAAPNREIAEGLLQAFMAFLASYQGIRATQARVKSGSQAAEYVLTVNGILPADDAARRVAR